MFKWFKKQKEAEFTIDVAKANYQEYLKGLIKQQQEYKLQLCEDIKWRSRHGYTWITTNSVGYQDYITKEYLNDLKIYFEEKGFTTKIINHDEYEYEYEYLKISWDEKI